MPRKGKDKPHESDDDELLTDGEPPSINPYEILGIDEKATAEQVKSAYRKQALRHHPGRRPSYLREKRTDKSPTEEKDAAHKKFQEIAFAYAILSDERRRKRYDLTGNTAETLAAEDSDSEFSWTDFYREQYSVAVDQTAIEELKNEYQGSEEERLDVLSAYEMHEGDMDGVFEEVMLSSVLDDEERFREIIERAIKDGEVEDHDKFSGESVAKRKKRAQKAKGEEKEAEELARELGVEEKLFGNGSGKGKKKKGGGKEDGEEELMALIQQRQKSRAQDFFADLEAKYAPKKKKRAGEKDEEPTKRQKRKG